MKRLAISFAILLMISCWLSASAEASTIVGVRGTIFSGFLGAPLSDLDGEGTLGFEDDNLRIQFTKPTVTGTKIELGDGRVTVSTSYLTGLSTFSLTVIATTDAHGFASASFQLESMMRITNLGDGDLNLFDLLRQYWSAVDPGGPTIGASVDHALSEYGAFRSLVSISDDGFGVGTEDLHLCDTRDPSSTGWRKLPLPDGASCGVRSPDLSDRTIFRNLAPGEFIEQSFIIRQSVEAFSEVSSPATLPLLFVGFMIAALGRDKKSSQGKLRN